MTGSGLFTFFVAFPPLLLAAILHEIAHGYTAEKLGDPTARTMGRITLNPIKHIDPFLTIILPGLLILSGSPVIFGGAKPIPVNPGYFKNPRTGMAIVAAAGPATNMVLGAIGFVVLWLLGAVGLFPVMTEVVAQVLILILVQWILINAVLALFNLFPLPPLDGGRIMTGLLPIRWAAPYARVERYGLIIVFLLLYLGVIDTYLKPIMNFLLELIRQILNA